MDSPRSRPCGGARVAPPADGLVLYRRARSSERSVQSSESNELPASQPAQPEASRMSGKGANQKEQVPCPKCKNRVQGRYMRKHDRNMHLGARRRRHARPYCSAEKAKTYSTFLDWRNHLQDTHEHCLEDDDPLRREEYAAGFKLDRWGRFHDLEGNDTDRAYQRVATLRKHYGQYQGPVEGEPPGPPSTIRLPYTKGTTPDREATPTESELAGSEHGESGQEEGEVTQAEGDELGSFTQLKSRDTNSGSEDTTPGRDSWRSARGRKTVMLTTPLTRGRGKRRMERGGGSTKRPRMESSLLESRDESEESRSGGARDRPGRGGRRAARPMTPPHCPPPPSASPRRSPWVIQSSAASDLRNLPLSAKTDSRTAHSPSVSGHEHGRGPSRLSRSSSDHGRSGQGRRSKSREPTPPQLINFSIDDFTVVSHTTDSFTFTSAHPFFPGWVRVVRAHRNDRVRGTPCAHNLDEELRAKRRVRRDVEPPEVRRFLRQELLRRWGTHGGICPGSTAMI